MSSEIPSSMSHGDHLETKDWRTLAAMIKSSAEGRESDSSKIQKQLRELEADLGKRNKEALIDSLTSYIDLQILHATALILESENPLLAVVATAKLQEHHEYKGRGAKGLVDLLTNKVSSCEALLRDNKTVVVHEQGGELAVWKNCLANIQEGIKTE